MFLGFLLNRGAERLDEYGRVQLACLNNNTSHKRVEQKNEAATKYVTQKQQPPSSELEL